MICLVSIFVVTLAVMYWWNTNAVGPIFDALNCTCLSQGERCHETHRFSYDFWYKYWKEDVPAVFKAVDGMKKGAAASFAEIGKLNPLPSTLLNQGLRNHLSL